MVSLLPLVVLRQQVVEYTPDSLCSVAVEEKEDEAIEAQEKKAKEQIDAQHSAASD